MRKLKPDGWADVTPRLFTSDVSGLAEFLRTAFHAEGDVYEDKPSVMRIGDTNLMISDGASLRAETAGFFYVYVDDVDATHARAAAAGAQVLEAPTNMPYGDRRSTVRDRWGNTWQIAVFGDA